VIKAGILYHLGREWTKRCFGGSLLQLSTVTKGNKTREF